MKATLNILNSTQRGKYHVRVRSESLLIVTFLLFTTSAFASNSNTEPTPIESSSKTQLGSSTESNNKNTEDTPDFIEQLTSDGLTESTSTDNTKPTPIESSPKTQLGSITESNSKKTEDTADFIEQLTSDGRIAVGFFGALIAMLSLFWGQYLNPLLKSRSEKISYLEYLRVELNSEKKRYEVNFAHDEVKSSTDNTINAETSWAKVLSTKNLPLPLELIHIHKLLDRSLSELSKENTYYPIITYTRLVDNIDHAHPLWKLSAEQTQLITTYLNTKNEIHHTIKSLYSQPIYDWITADNPETKKRWIYAAQGLLDELAQHYIAIEELNKDLEKWLKPFFGYYWRV